LISAAVNGVTTTYLYDALSRRIAKIPTTGSATLYIYDGFNCIAEYTGTTLSKTRTWGLDLSGTLQGAGGVGGLLAEKQGDNYFYPTYDGNGNVSEYLTIYGVVQAHFEYDPFGNTTVDTDNANAPLFAYRFSTKPLDFETGLYYYGYRYYDPLTGRWPSRDPIAEQGGINLYGFIGNAPIDHIDLFGKFSKYTDCSPKEKNVIQTAEKNVKEALQSFVDSIDNIPDDVGTFYSWLTSANVTPRITPRGQQYRIYKAFVQRIKGKVQLILNDLNSDKWKAKCECECTGKRNDSVAYNQQSLFVYVGIWTSDIIHFCPVFFTAEGFTDNMRAGTIAHEGSHLTLHTEDDKSWSAPTDGFEGGMLELAQPYDKLGQVGADNDKLLLTIQHWVLAAATGNDFAIPGLHLP
jgi:RHS repeat-associated protein